VCFLQVDGVALPALHALLDKLVETNKTAEEIARRVLPAIQKVLERYVRHVLPREMSAVRSKAARSIRIVKAALALGGGSAGPLEMSLNAARRRASMSPVRGAAAAVDGGGNTVGQRNGKPRGKKLNSDDVLGNLDAWQLSESLPRDDVDLDRDIFLLSELIGKQSHTLGRIAYNLNSMKHHDE
jgi:hypothetical protein